MLKEFAAFLREQRDRLVRSVEVQGAPKWNPTEGYTPGDTEYLDVIDFDALLEAMDAFGEELRARKSA